MDSSAGTSSAEAEADALHARVRATIRLEHCDDDAFDALARDLARFQHARHPGYARLCAARGVDPARDRPRALPAVPTDAFRMTRVATFAEGREAAVFRTSGTTVGTRGAHPMRTLDTYRDAAMTFARATLFAPFVELPTVLAIAPSAADAPDSSLSRMLGWFVDEAAPNSRNVRPDRPEEVEAALRGARGPVVVAATAFAWIHFVDYLGARALQLALPPGSRAMQTGGFKGRSREVSASDLRRAIAHALALPERQIVGEYGMTELTSQLWAVDEEDARWMYRAPHWVRVVACDPLTLAPLPDGTRGIARFEDLGNVESAWAVQTADEVIVHAGPHGRRVELLGRAPGATPRGCSLAIEELLTPDHRARA